MEKPKVKQTNRKTTVHKIQHYKLKTEYHETLQLLHSYNSLPLSNKKPSLCIYIEEVVYIGLMKNFNSRIRNCKIVIVNLQTLLAT